MKKIYFSLIVCFILLLIFGACSTLYIEGASVQTPVEEVENSIKKDSIVMRCKLNYVKINTVEKMYFPYRGKISTLILNYNRSYEGFASCNSFFGQYTMDGKNIHFQLAISTSRACYESTIEKIVLSVLCNIDNYTIKNKQILLKRDDEIQMVYDID